LDLRDKRTALYSTIENFWLQAVTNQNKFKAAKVATESAETSYEMLSGKFQESLINIVELMKGRDAVIQAKQNELQSKYLSILNIELLHFYQDGKIKGTRD
jgi:outer membrane protein